MKRALMGAAVAALCLLAACEDQPRPDRPGEPVNMVRCEGNDCLYPDGTPR